MRGDARRRENKANPEGGEERDVNKFVGGWQRNEN
jgi:hypothetical protein